MAFQFPSGPIIGQIFEPIAGITYSFDGTGWVPFSVDFITLAAGDARWLQIADASSLVPTGSVTAYAGSAAPADWLLCYGQAISRTTYAALFAIIGVTYGVGDGATTFNLPDLRGRAVFGKDNMGGVAANRVTAAGSGLDGLTLGAVGGSQLLQSHSHIVIDPGHTHPIDNLLSSTPGVQAVDVSTPSAATYSATGSALTGVTIQNAGAGGSQNIPPAIVLNYIIKT
jgi:microcystin-dependent protein